MKKISELLSWGNSELKESTNESFISSQILLCHVLKINRTKLYTNSDQKISLLDEKIYQQLIEKRKIGYPVAYLIGSRKFWTLDLMVNSSTLIPRPETEHLIETVINIDLPDKSDVLDLGTGCGAIAIALASEKPNWEITASDFSISALKIAKKNIKKYSFNNIHIHQSNWFNQINKKFDLIISNPPYIAENDPHLKQGDLNFEPKEALCSGKNGYEAIEIIILNSPQHLKPNGWLFFEHGHNQEIHSAKMLEKRGFRNIRNTCDISGMQRIIGGQYTSNR